MADMHLLPVFWVQILWSSIWQWLIYTVINATKRNHWMAGWENFTK